MQLTKIIEINNVGRLQECKNISLKTITLIYGENGRGKSTLAEILRSLSIDNPQIIQARSTAENDNNPQIKLLFDEIGVCNYENGAWSQKHEFIEVFDDLFINENIYSGVTIDSSHRANLYKYTIGSLVVKATNEELELSNEFTRRSNELTAVESEFNQLNIEISLNDFADLSEISDVDAKIESVQKNISQINNTNVIQNKSNLRTIKPPIIDFEAYEKIVGQSVEDISVDAEVRVKEHIRNHLQTLESSEDWLKQGIQNADDTCPFCGQTLSENILIEAYRDFFNQSYKNFKNDIDETLSKASTETTEAVLLRSVQSDIGQNNVLIEFWKQHLSIQIPEFDFETTQDHWRVIRDILLDVIKRKQNAPLEKIQPDTLNHAREHYMSIQDSLEVYNQIIESINHKIQLLKEKISTTNGEDEQKELVQLQINKQRFTENSIDLCNRFQKAKQEKSTAKKKRDEARKKLDEEIENFDQKYKEFLNECLQDFGVDISIDYKHDRKGRGKSRTTLTGKIGEKIVELDHSNEDQPSFKDVLSTGDKASLALAFFFAKLQQLDEETLQNTIVVLDDPINSFGSHRRRKTIEYILQFATKVKQLILLSHDEFFLNSVLEKAQNGYKTKDIDILLLEFERKEKASRLTYWDIQAALETDYHKCYRNLLDFLENGTSDKRKLKDVRSDLRMVLEENLRMRFPVDLSTLTLGQCLHKLLQPQVSEKLSELRKNEAIFKFLQDVNDYANNSHHIDSESTSDTELRLYVKRVLNFVHHNNPNHE